MSTHPEFVGTVHIFLGPCRGNPIGLYLRKEGDTCSIAPTLFPWSRVVGVGDTENKAAADFDAKWKAGDVAPEMYSGPHWEGGIKPEKPKPPPKPPAETATQPPAPSQSGDAAAPSQPTPPDQASRAVTSPPSQSTPPAQDSPTPSSCDPGFAEEPPAG